MATLKPELRQQVAEAFEARQQLQQAELVWLRQRLARIENQIGHREPIKEQIIDRRVDELLNPYLKWDSLKPLANRAATPTRSTLSDPSGTGDKPTAADEPVQPSDVQKLVQTRNNLKELALAMHNYHDASFGGRRSFPPAVVTRPDGKAPRSWRVELLPFLGRADLYQQYRKDEPWHGPHNKQLIAQMPAVFRSPYDDPHSTSSGYYAIVGPDTAFDPQLKGVQMTDIKDGTSNTLLLVEAKRNIPWTKPDDIPFDPDQPLPELGGFVKGKFAAAMADGAAYVFDRKEVDNILKWMILRNDQQPLAIPIP